MTKKEQEALNPKSKAKASSTKTNRGSRLHYIEPFDYPYIDAESHKLVTKSYMRNKPKFYQKLDERWWGIDVEPSSSTSSSSTSSASLSTSSFLGNYSKQREEDPLVSIKPGISTTEESQQRAKKWKMIGQESIAGNYLVEILVKGFPPTADDLVIASLLRREGNVYYVEIKEGV